MIDAVRKFIRAVTGESPPQSFGGTGTEAGYESPVRRAIWGPVDHELKTAPEHFRAVWTGEKKAELRRDDRAGGFRPGQRIRLREWDGDYTGRWMNWTVSHVIGGSDGLRGGYAIISLGDCYGDSAGAGDYDHGG